MNRLWSLALTIWHFLWARWRWRRLRGRRLRRWQQSRARRIVRYAAEKSPFYRRHWAGCDLEKWRTLPTVDKRLMMENFDEFNTVGLGKDAAMQVALEAERSRDFSPVLNGYTVGLSSGTSGHRGIFLAGAWEQATWAGCILSRTLHEIKPRKLRVAFFLRSNSNLYEKIGGILIKFRFFDLMLPLEQAVRELNSFKPHIIVGPPSLLGFLADAKESGNLHIEPERLVSVAEVLEPQDSARLKGVFGVKTVEQIYQCTEGLLAITCKEGSLHIQEDLVVMQLERLGDGRSMPIVTDLWRQTQPIIRYRLNDVLRIRAEGEGCACGSPFMLIEAIEGRADDVVYFFDKQGDKRAFFPDTIRRMALLADDRIEDYYAAQERVGHLRLHLVVKQNAEFVEVAERVMVTAQNTLAQYGCGGGDVEVVEGLPVMAAGVKRRRVVRIAD